MPDLSETAPAGLHDAKLLAEIRRQPGQTKWGLKAKLKIGTGPFGRALDRLITAGLVGLQRDQAGRARCIALEQWAQGVTGVAESPAEGTERPDPALPSDQSDPPG